MSQLDLRRLFFAIEIPEDVKAALGRVRDALSVGLPRGAVRWVKPNRMHLTLRFLGDTAEANVPHLAQALDQAMAAQRPFQLRLGELGCFPNRKRPRVLWVGLSGDVAQLQAIKRGLDDALVPLGISAETKPYKPHLTLGRVKDARALSGLNWQTPVAPKTWPVSAVALIESNLTPQGPIYTIRHTSTMPR